MKQKPNTVQVFWVLKANSKRVIIIIIVISCIKKKKGFSSPLVEQSKLQAIKKVICNSLLVIASDHKIFIINLLCNRRKK